MTSKWGVAMCRRCSEPLVATLAWDRAEFYCLTCGARLGFLEPDGSPETPELLARAESVRAEFLALGGADVIPDHRLGLASDEGLARHEAAIARLAARVSGARA